MVGGRAWGGARRQAAALDAACGPIPAPPTLPGRHPLAEAAGDGPPYIPNDTRMGVVPPPGQAPPVSASAAAADGAPATLPAPAAPPAAAPQFAALTLRSTTVAGWGLRIAGGGRGRSGQSWVPHPQ